MSQRVFQTIDKLRAIEAQLRDVEAVLRELDDSPADAPEGRVFVKLSHAEDTNRIRVMIDCHLSKAVAVLESQRQVAENLAENYLTNPPEETE